MSDYITYTWVKDDEVAFNDEVMQVVNCSFFDTLSGGIVSEKILR